MYAAMTAIATARRKTMSQFDSVVVHVEKWTDKSLGGKPDSG